MSIIKRYTPQYAQVIPGFRQIGDSVYHDPVTNSLYTGEDEYGDPTWDTHRWNLTEYSLKQASLKDGDYNDDIGAALAGVNQNDYQKAAEYLAIETRMIIDGATKADNYLKQAAILQRDDFTQYKTIKSMGKVIAATPRKHALLGLVPVRNTTELEEKLWMWDGPFDVVNENIPELNIPWTGTTGFTSQQVQLTRYGTHMAFSEEFLGETYDVDIKGAITNNMSGQIDVVKNKKIADVLNAATLTSYGDWSAKTSNVSARDPGPDINAEATKIFGTDKDSGRYIMATSRAVKQAYDANSFNNGYGTLQFKPETFGYGNQLFSGFTRFDDIRWAVDSFITNKRFVLFDPDAILFLQGPSKTINYTGQYQDHRGTIFKTFFSVKTLDSDRVLGGSAVLP